MIFRKQPLIDADWLLGPSDRKPSPLFRLDIGFGVLLTSAVLVGSWTVLSDRVISLRNLSFGHANASQNTATHASEEEVEKTPSEIVTDEPIDRSRIKTVDRFVPGHRSIELESTDKLASTTAKRQATSKFEEIGAPIKLPEIGKELTVENAISARDLRMYPVPSLPMELLSDSGSQGANVASDASEWFNANGATNPGSSQGTALQRPPQLTKVVRTIAYSGRLANESATNTLAGEPPPLVANALRSPRLMSADESESTAASVATDEVQMLAGLDKRETGEVVRLLASVQPRIAGAALNELKRRKFTDDRIELAIELTSGTRQQRIASMDRLVSERSIAPLQWLVWMAEDEDRDVREHAVRMLASIPDEDARRQMRLLMIREKDLALSNLLRQACLSSGVVDARRER